MSFVDLSWFHLNLNVIEFEVMVINRKKSIKINPLRRSTKNVASTEPDLDAEEK